MPEIDRTTTGRSMARRGESMLGSRPWASLQQGAPPADPMERWSALDEHLLDATWPMRRPKTTLKNSSKEYVMMRSIAR